MTVRIPRPRLFRSPRSVAAAGLLALATSSAALVLPATNAFAHGAATTPGSRTYLCYEDGHWTGGDLQPRNPACASAVAKGGKQPLWDWFGVLRGDGAGRMSGFIPDGSLCSGGNAKYAAYDEARADWPATRLTAGAKWSFHYNAWAPHPGEFRLYITKDGYDPTKPLKWSDLETAPFSTWSETTPNGTGEYYWDTTLPKKTGRHIIYSVWARTDSKETFYNCSDVVFDGGNGQVINDPGSNPAPTTSAPAPTTPTTQPAPTTTTPTAAPTTTPPAPTTPAPTTPPATDPAGGSGCTGQVNVKPWSGGYLGTVTVVNHGPAAQPWNVKFTVPSGLKLYAGWNADVTLSGTTVTAVAPAWYRAMKTGSEVSIGFVAGGPSTPAPSGVTLNGTPCRATGSGSSGTPSSTTPPATTPPATSAVPSTSTTAPAPSTSTTTASPGGGGTGTASFSDGFEAQTGAAPAGNWTVTAKDCSGTGKASVDSAVAHTGSKSLRIDGGAGYCNHVFVAASQSLTALGKTVFTRVYVKHTTAQPASHTTFLAMKDTADNGKDLRVGGQNSALQWNRESDDATLPAQSPAGVAQSTALPTGTWQCLELEVNGANGTAHTWLNGKEVKGLTADGVPTTDVDNQWYGKTWRPAVSDLRLGWESYGDGTDTLWYDDVAIGTSRIGC